VHVEVLAAGNIRGIDAAFAGLAQKRVDALLVSSDSLFNSRRVQLATLAVHHRVPTMFPFREHAAAGGLMSYGGSIAETFHTVGVYTGRILKGERPANLPVQQMTRIELVINLKTAKALGLTFPITLLGRADEVIE
jgi:putative ABC transport system substrate-binding protein